MLRWERESREKAVDHLVEEQGRYPDPGPGWCRPHSERDLLPSLPSQRQIARALSFGKGGIQGYSLGKEARGPAQDLGSGECCDCLVNHKNPQCLAAEERDERMLIPVGCPD